MTMVDEAVEALKSCTRMIPAWLGSCAVDEVTWLVFRWICEQASQGNWSVDYYVTVNTEYVSEILGLDKSDVSESLHLLYESGMVFRNPKIRDRTMDVQIARLHHPAYDEESRVEDVTDPKFDYPCNWEQDVPLALAHTPSRSEVMNTLLVRYRATCVYCKREGTADLGPDGRAWTRDHVLPKILGGEDAGNLVLACASCNRKKHAKPVEEFLATLA